MPAQAAFRSAFGWHVGGWSASVRRQKFILSGTFGRAGNVGGFGRCDVGGAFDRARAEGTFEKQSRRQHSPA
jgi:hypothetical protein